VTAGFSRTRWPGTLRPYQAAALDQLGAAWAAGRRRAWVVLPPGAGKTLIGLEAARRLSRRVVVLVPNTAIQEQWVAHWRRFTPATTTAGSDRALGADVTVLTYQSLAVFDPDAETDEEGHARSPLRRLHANGRELITRLADAGPLTLVLDECHHLLDVWGRLVAEVLDRLPDAIVLGLTGTPPESLSPAEATLVDTLFGTPILGASIPALVREGHLAPFAELAWLTPPTAVEADHIAGEAERFAELTTDLVTSTDFLTWLDARFTAHTVPWART
jgi:superfamily II DNA or RNA helicase